MTEASIDDTRKKLDSIAPQLDKILEATKPLQQFFDISITEKREQGEVSQYLPPELYILYVQSNALKEAKCKNFRLSNKLQKGPDWYYKSIFI